MKAISLRQPWAELVVSGVKTIETRDWNTSFRGSFLVHASKTIDVEACERLGFDPGSLATGAIVGEAELVDVKRYEDEAGFRRDERFHRSIRFVRYGFLLRNARRLEPRPAKGALSFFETDG